MTEKIAATPKNESNIFVSVPRRFVSFDASLYLDQTVAEFVEHVEKSQGVRLSPHYRLFYNGRKLPSRRTLRECDVTTNGILVLKRRRSVESTSAGKTDKSSSFHQREGVVSPRTGSDEEDNDGDGDDEEEEETKDASGNVNGKEGESDDDDDDDDEEDEEKRRLEAAKQLQLLQYGGEEKEKEKEEELAPPPLPPPPPPPLSYSYDPTRGAMVLFPSHALATSSSYFVAAPPPPQGTTTPAPHFMLNPSSLSLYRHASHLVGAPPTHNPYGDSLSKINNEAAKYYRSLPKNPLEWSSEQVQHWLRAFEVRYRAALSLSDKGKFRMNGRGLALMRLRGFQYRLGDGRGDLAYRDFQSLLRIVNVKK